MGGPPPPHGGSQTVLWRRDSATSAARQSTVWYQKYEPKMKSVFTPSPRVAANGSPERDLEVKTVTSSGFPTLDNLFVIHFCFIGSLLLHDLDRRAVYRVKRVRARSMRDLKTTILNDNSDGELWYTTISDLTHSKFYLGAKRNRESYTPCLAHPTHRAAPSSSQSRKEACIFWCAYSRKKKRIVENI